MNYTPMMEQYREIKKAHPNELLLFRLGDFYELFFDDAELAARELEITLTSREAGQNIRVPMCGVPFHAIDSYLARLIAKGYRVAICEQVEDPKETKGLVKREVVKIVTPGTVLSETSLSDRSNNYLAALAQEEDAITLAVTDISTGECFWCSFVGADRYVNLISQLSRVSPSEIIICGKIDLWTDIESFLQNKLPQTTVTSYFPSYEKEYEYIPLHFSSTQIPAEKSACSAVEGLLQYLHMTLKSELRHLNQLRQYSPQESLMLDAVTLRNLEVTKNMREGTKKGSLLGTLDSTVTAMGGRLLKQWLESPLISRQSIENRLDSVEELFNQPQKRELIRQQLKSVYDFERILSRIEVGSANARDFMALRVSLEALPDIKATLGTMYSRELSLICRELNLHEDCTDLIRTAIIDSPPISIREGHFIRDGYDLELDELRSLSRDNKEWVQQMEAREKENTGIKSLKIGFNKVFGYYIEVTHSNTNSVPAYFIRKQTLVNAERYITPELKEFENRILTAQEKIVQLEYLLFQKIRNYVKERIIPLQHSARFIAVLDCLSSFAQNAADFRYSRPSITNDDRICIKEGRHPVIERLCHTDRFVPNDTLLDHDGSEIIILTGPNMAGKSTYMRQVALIILMAQCGSFVPAKEVRLTPVDRIFSRVGASDDLASGHSTFMVEMTEVAAILKHASSNSFIILDEIGRGTSTFDGMSIARAVIEYIKEKLHSRTIFATHYHELTILESWHSGIRNQSMAVKERGNEIQFLRRVIEGGADKSYGVHVAQLAGLPKKVVERAHQLLTEMEESPNQQQSAAFDKSDKQPNTMVNTSLFCSTLPDELISLDIDTITPLEAINILNRLHLQAKREAGKI